MAGKTGKARDTSTSKNASSDVATASGLSVALSAIVAAIWAGVWGFNWAATHLSEGDMYVAIIVGLGGGMALTAYSIERTFWAVRSSLNIWKEVAIAAIKAGKDIPTWPGGIVSVRVVPQPSSDPKSTNQPPQGDTGEWFVG